METAIVWGWILTAQIGNLPPIIDPNYKSEEDCQMVLANFIASYPDYAAYCTPTWKPETVHHKRHVARRAHVSHHRVSRHG